MAEFTTTTTTLTNNPKEATATGVVVSDGKKRKANIALIGAGWWSQGWHLPHLSRNEDNVSIVAIVDTCSHPKSSLNPNLESLSALSKRYGGNHKKYLHNNDCPVYSSVTELLNSNNNNLDGVMICTPHATHYQIAKELLDYNNNNNRHDDDNNDYNDNRPLHIFMEKPMTTNVHQAIRLHELLSLSCETRKKKKKKMGCFMVNHSANYRAQARVARDIIQSGKIGQVRHVNASFASPLSWIFDDPAQIGWNQPSPPPIY